MVTPAVTLSPVDRDRSLLNQVPLTRTVPPSVEPEDASRRAVSDGAKSTMLYAQKIVLMLPTSSSLRKEVGSDSPPVSYRPETTASALGWTTMLEPYVVSSALSLSPTSRTTPSIATEIAVDRATVSAMRPRRRG